MALRAVVSLLYPWARMSMLRSIKCCMQQAAKAQRRSRLQTGSTVRKQHSKEADRKEAKGEADNQMTSTMRKTS